jgi:hypothetical protein
MDLKQSQLSGIMTRDSNITAENRDSSIDFPDLIWKISSLIFGPKASHRDKVPMVLFGMPGQMLPSHSYIRRL